MITNGYLNYLKEQQKTNETKVKIGVGALAGTPDITELAELKLEKTPILKRDVTDGQVEVIYQVAPTELVNMNINEIGFTSFNMLQSRTVREFGAKSGNEIYQIVHRTKFIDGGE